MRCTSVSTARAIAVGVAYAVAVTGCALPRASASTDAPDLSRDATELAVLTYNVKSLPFPFGGTGKAARMQAIGTRLRDYDLVMLQEAFTSVPDLLAGLDARGSIVSERFGPAQTTERLTRTTGLAVGAFAPLAASSFHQVGHFGVCSGTFTRAMDCLASKGFILQRTRFSGTEIDVYDTHLDSDSLDQPTRLQQLATLTAEIRRLSGSRPLIVAGDFNIERTDEDQHRALAQFAADLGLTDAQATPSAGWPERIDYIFVRGSSDAALSVVRAGEDPRFRDGFHALSDHPAVFAVLRVTAGHTSTVGR